MYQDHKSMYRNSCLKKRKVFQPLSNRAHVKSEKRASFHTRKRARSTPLPFGLVDVSYLILPGRVVNGDAITWVLTGGSIQRPFRPHHTHNHLMSGHLGVKNYGKGPKGRSYLLWGSGLSSATSSGLSFKLSRYLAAFMYSG